jgi:type I restriction-modification system DNA methylase subunit
LRQTEGTRLRSPSADPRQLLSAEAVDDPFGADDAALRHLPGRAGLHRPDDHRGAARAHHSFADEPGFTRAVPLDEIRAKDGNLSISLYISASAQTGASGDTTSRTPNPSRAIKFWLQSSVDVRKALEAILK